MSLPRYYWAAPGDVNAFFGLMLDNIAVLLLTVGLLAGGFGFPADFVLQHLIPGTAIGVLVGDLLFFWTALQLARRTGRPDTTAMPLGLDTPSTFGMMVFVLGPVFRESLESQGDAVLAARLAWHTGICAIVLTGLFKLVCSFAAGGIRRLLPRAGLLGSLAAIALVLISFVPLLEVLRDPLVGLVALAIVLTTLVARVDLPLRIPGALGALLVAGPLYFLMKSCGLLAAVAEPMVDPAAGLLPLGWLEVFRFEWIGAMPIALNYLPVVIPFALATVVGGIDCTESAASVGDEYHTGWVIGVEALATLVAGLCGGVIQSTPYIGHPAYKAMGGRAAYTLATALFVGGAGVLGYFGYLYVIMPKAAVFPILIFVGLEITAQSFQATPRRHYAAVALACIPALAVLALLFADRVLGDPAIAGLGISAASLQDSGLKTELQTLRVLANGFLVTSLIWASALAALIDRHLRLAAAYFGVAALCTLFGIIHSPLPGGQVFVPWGDSLPPAAHRIVIMYALGYAAVAGLLLGWRSWLGTDPPPE